MVPAHTAGQDNRIVTALGARLLINAQTACPGTESLLWYNPATKAEPLQSSLFGMHGSLTAAEQLVPMFAFAAQLAKNELCRPRSVVPARVMR